jgi:hypothetical protein
VFQLAEDARPVTEKILATDRHDNALPAIDETKAKRFNSVLATLAGIGNMIPQLVTDRGLP